MAKAKKKMKTAARKAKKTAVKNKSAMKKAAKPAAKKKTASAPRKKVAAKESSKAAKPVAKNKKITAVPMTRMPETMPMHANASMENEAEKQQELVQPNRRDQNRKLERQFHEHQDMAMKMENQKVKSAMAKRQSMKPIFHGPR